MTSGLRLDTSPPGRVPTRRHPMPRRTPVLAVCTATALALGLSSHQSPADTPKGASPFAGFVDAYYDAFFTWNPSQGTAAGLHHYDTALEDRSAAAVANRIDTLKNQQQALARLRSGKLSADEVIDAEVLDGALRAELLDLEVVQNWRKNPMNYVGTPGQAVDGLMKRTFAPAPARLRSVIARLKATPALLVAMRENVTNPPREFTDLAIRMGEGSVGFFRDSVRDWAKEAAGGDAKL